MPNLLTADQAKAVRNAFAALNAVATSHAIRLSVEGPDERFTVEDDMRGGLQISVNGGLAPRSREHHAGQEEFARAYGI